MESRTSLSSLKGLLKELDAIRATVPASDRKVCGGACNLGVFIFFLLPLCFRGRFKVFIHTVGGRLCIVSPFPMRHGRGSEFTKVAWLGPRCAPLKSGTRQPAAQLARSSPFRYGDVHQFPCPYPNLNMCCASTPCALRVACFVFLMCVCTRDLWPWLNMQAKKALRLKHSLDALSVHPGSLASSLTSNLESTEEWKELVRNGLRGTSAWSDVFPNEEEPSTTKVAAAAAATTPAASPGDSPAGDSTPTTGEERASSTPQAAPEAATETEDVDMAPAGDADHAPADAANPPSTTASEEQGSSDAPQTASLRLVTLAQLQELLDAASDLTIITDEQRALQRLIKHVEVSVPCVCHEVSHNALQRSC